MAAAVEISFGRKISVKFQWGDIELEALGCVITLLWNARWRNDGLFIHKIDTGFDRHWTWPEIVHRLKFWRRDEFRWPPHK